MFLTFLYVISIILIKGNLQGRFMTHGRMKIMQTVLKLRKKVEEHEKKQGKIEKSRKNKKITGKITIFLSCTLLIISSDSLLVLVNATSHFKDQL